MSTAIVSLDVRVTDVHVYLLIYPVQNYVDARHVKLQAQLFVQKQKSVIVNPMMKPENKHIKYNECRNSLDCCMYLYIFGWLGGLVDNNAALCLLSRSSMRAWVGAYLCTWLGVWIACSAS